MAVLAGLIIFPAAFSVGIQPDAGPSLIFITLPNVFQQAFSGGADISLYFLGDVLCLAGFGCIDFYYFFT